VKFILSLACVVAILAASSIVWAAATADGFEIIIPPDKSFVEGELLSIVATVSRFKVDELQVSVNGIKQQITHPFISRDTQCLEGTRLSYGMNEIKVTGYLNGKQTGDVVRKVYYHSDTRKEASTLPEGFRRYLFHGNSAERECSTCHPVNLRTGGDKKRESDRSPCYVCHKKIIDYKFVHGPAAVWSCTQCHEANSKGSKLAVAGPVSDICSTCHEFSWNNKKYMHAPTAAGMCISCHSPHASDNPYFLRLKTNQMCTSCHDEVPSRPHIIIGFSGNGHPLEIVPNQANKGKKLMCTSCHNPHGEDSSKLLNGYDERTSRLVFCKTCHDF
jgi:predicted CXXCH cytochrome family protein